MHPGDDQVYGTDLAQVQLSPVDRWRKNVFVGAGFEEHTAELLALSKAVVHDVLKALDGGCSLELAFEIFY